MHQLKGSVVNLRIKEVAGKAIQAEVFIENGSIKSAKGTFAEIRLSIDELCSYFRAIIG